MITRPPSRPQTLLRAVTKQLQPKQSPLLQTPFQRRCIHAIPIWGNQLKQEFFARHGVPGFLSAETYQETYLEYSKHMIKQLNAYTQGTVDEGSSTRDLHRKYAHRADKAYLYNISAMLTFTRFFWEECLTNSNDPADRRPGPSTSRTIEASFGSLDTLKEEMLETADAMFGNGFVWLMKGKTVGDMRILATYNAGSPYSDAAPRRDNKDMATHSYNSQALADQLSGRSGFGPPRTHERDIAMGNQTAGLFGDHSPNNKKEYEGLLDMSPILCVNVWEHQWLKDYGLLGKKLYLSSWWDSIDWQKVEILHKSIHEPANYYQQSSFPSSSPNLQPYERSGGRGSLDVYGQERQRATGRFY